jgi:23S rRNA (uracil1939-C5)-methyltransferase
MWRSGRTESERILPIIPAPEPYGYRARIQLKLRFVADELHMGFYRGGSHFVVDVPGECAIAHPAINRLVPELQQMIRIFPDPEKIPQIDVTTGDDDSAVAIFHYIGSNHAVAAGFIKENHAILASAAGIYIQYGRKGTLQKIIGRETLEYPVSQEFVPGVADCRLTFTPGGFSQVNYRQNLALIATVFDWAGLTGKERVLDIYCGNGNFTIPLAAWCSEIFGFEEYRPSIKDALHNCQLNGLRNAVFRCTDAVAGLQEVIDKGDTFDILLLDPPRTGAAEIVRLIPSLNPAKIVYISCDPSTLARDISTLRGLDYGVVKILPVDMFPQTYHIESVTLLEPSSKKILSSISEG